MELSKVQSWVEEFPPNWNLFIDKSGQFLVISSPNGTNISTLELSGNIEKFDMGILKNNCTLTDCEL
jgi:hypothetical protein